MNLIQQAEQLKNLPDQALAQMQQRPTETPPYLVVAEMQRRANMRKAYQNAQQGPPMQSQPPVAQQMAQQLQQPQQAPQQMPQMPMAPPPMQMAGGGLATVAKYFDGGFVPVPTQQVDPMMIGMGDTPGYSTMNDERFNAQRRLMERVPEIEDIPAYVKKMEGAFGGTKLQDLADQLGVDEKEMRGQKPKLSQILMQLGLGMAASRNPTFAGAVGEGGLGALQGYTREKERTNTLADRIAEKRLRAIEGVQRHQDRVRDYAVDARGRDIAAANMARGANNNIELGIMRQSTAEGSQLAQENRDAARYQAAMELAAQKDAEQYRREKEKLDKTTETQLKIAQMRESGRAGRRGSGEKAEKPVNPMDLVKAFGSMADDYDKQALELSKTLMILPEAKRGAVEQQIEALQQKSSVMRQRSMAIIDKISGFEQAPDTSNPPKKKMSAEEFLNRLPDGANKAGQQTTPQVKWPTRMPELIGERTQEVDPMMRGLGALGRMFAPEPLPQNRTIQYR